VRYSATIQRASSGVAQALTISLSNMEDASMLTSMKRITFADA